MVVSTRYKHSDICVTGLSGASNQHCDEIDWNIVLVGLQKGRHVVIKTNALNNTIIQGNEIPILIKHSFTCNMRMPKVPYNWHQQISFEILNILHLSLAYRTQSEHEVLSLVRRSFAYCSLKRAHKNSLKHFTVLISKVYLQVAKIYAP